MLDACIAHWDWSSIALVSINILLKNFRHISESSSSIFHLHLQIIITDMGNRIARIQNDTPWSISMKEHRMLGGSTSQYSYTIRVDPNDNTEIPASLFLKRNHQYGMPSEIVIFTDGTEVRKSLISQHFVRYVKIILCVEGPYLVVKGVLPQFLDLCWFR